MTEWINVKDKTPDHYQKTLFWVKDREDSFAGWFDKEKNRFQENLDSWWFNEERITHWMPLPEPPKT